MCHFVMNCLIIGFMIFIWRFRQVDSLDDATCLVTLGMINNLMLSSLFFCHILVLSVSVWKLILKRWVGPGLIYTHELYFQLHWLCEAVLSQLTEHIEINQDELQYLRVRYFTLLLYPYDYRSYPDRIGSITACSSQENNFSSWKKSSLFLWSSIWSIQQYKESVHLSFSTNAAVSLWSNNFL